jgi:hypothetical protein
MFPDGLLGSTLTGLTFLIGACDDFVTGAGVRQVFPVPYIFVYILSWTRMAELFEGHFIVIYQNWRF